MSITTSVFGAGKEIRVPLGQTVTITNGKEAGTKHDQGKPRWSLLSMKFLEEMSRVLTYGAQKYASHNWRKGIEVSRSLDAAFRHLSAAAEGQDIDTDPATKEWLLSNLAQAAINCMFAWETIRERPDFDDRYKGEKK